MSAEQRCSCSNCAYNQPGIESATTEPKMGVQTDRRVQPEQGCEPNLCHAMLARRGEAGFALGRHAGGHSWESRQIRLCMRILPPNRAAYVYQDATAFAGLRYLLHSPSHLLDCCAPHLQTCSGDAIGVRLDHDTALPTCDGSTGEPTSGGRSAGQLLLGGKLRAFHPSPQQTAKPSNLDPSSNS